MSNTVEIICNLLKIKSIFYYVITALKYGNSELHGALFKYIKKVIIGEDIIKL